MSDIFNKYIMNQQNSDVDIHIYHTAASTKLPLIRSWRAWAVAATERNLAIKLLLTRHYLAPRIPNAFFVLEKT
jgi:hypothetical protein